MGQRTTKNPVLNKLHECYPKIINNKLLLIKMFCKLDKIHNKRFKEIKISKINIILIISNKLDVVKYITTIRIKLK